jgi:putative transposase
LWEYDASEMESNQTNPKIQKHEGLVRMNPSSGFGSNARMTRGMEIAEKGVISENADGNFSVPSQTSGSVYQVKLLGAGWVCTCPDFENRADSIEMCKHAFAVKFWTASRVELQEKPKPKVFADDALQCGKCGSIRVVKFGHSDGKQIFKCRDCGRKFRDNLLPKTRYSPEMITLTLDLYFSGLSLHKIARTLNDHFDMNLGKATVYRWIQRYVPQISEYVNSLTPQLSDTWHADEVFVKMKGGETVRKMDNMAYLWNVMDRKTRYLIASTLSKHRDVGGADRAFRTSIANAHGSEPEHIFTDGLRAYGESIPLTFPTKPEHIARAGIKKPHANNNRIERLNGTVRERVKVQRGWKSMETPLAEGFRLQYNFVKPHMALDGQTPAQAAGIGVSQRNKWMELLRQAITRSETGGEITRQ